MKIIKLDAIDSTNTFLKEMCAKNKVDDFTVVVAKHQTKGRGQMQNSWTSGKGKNLTFSILIRFEALNVNHQFYLSKAISLAIYEVLAALLSSKTSIKWPNDIMAENKKICGILIENSIKQAKIYQTIVGIGVNVNQINFDNLPKATSLKLISNKNYNLDVLLKMLLESIKKYIKILTNNSFNLLDELYLKQLYKINKPMMFKDGNGLVFLGKITDVSTQGKLVVMLENKNVCKFNFKEIGFANAT